MAGEGSGGRGGGKGGDYGSSPAPLFLSPSDDLQGTPFQRSPASAIEYMDSNEKNEKRKEGAKIQSCTVIA